MISTTTKRAKPKRYSELAAQANATRRAAALSTASPSTIEGANAGANQLDALQRSRDRKAATGASAVLVIPPEASPAELQHARRNRAVSLGNSVYLPSWKPTVSGLPNALLRSSLFGVAELDTKMFVDFRLATQGEAMISLTGGKLTDYDRQVFSTILSFYRDRPLSNAGVDSEWIGVSFWQFAKAMGSQPGKNVRLAICNSLLRLDAAKLSMRVNRRNIPLQSLVDVELKRVLPDPQGNTTHVTFDIEFRVPSEVAELYGPQDWTGVPHSALECPSGLVRWLATYYSTHSVPYPLGVEYLRQLSGSICSLSQFRRRLHDGLTWLKQADTPDEIRVREYNRDPVTDAYTVHLSCWPHAPLLPA